MKVLHIITFILLVVGGLNWFLFAFGWNLVSAVFGAGTLVTRIIYILVGLSAIWEIVMHRKNCRTCNPGGATM